MKQTKSKNIEQNSALTAIADTAVLIVFNDDENTFEWVIESFVDICQLNIDDAVKKTVSIHLKGQDAVCEGEYIEMKTKKDKLIERTINAIVSRPNFN